MKSEFFHVLRFSSYVYRNGERVRVYNDEIIDFESYDSMMSKIHLSLIESRQLPSSLVHLEIQYDSTDDCYYHSIVLDFHEWWLLVKRSFQIEMGKI